MNHISINIWDDYIDDGSGFQETDIMVECDHISKDTEHRVLRFLMHYITNNIPLENTTFKVYWRDPKVIYPNWADTGLPESFWAANWRLRAANLSHVQREYLLKKLNSDKTLLFNGSTFEFYSES